MLQFSGSVVDRLTRYKMLRTHMGAHLLVCTHVPSIPLLRRMSNTSLKVFTVGWGSFCVFGGMYVSFLGLCTSFSTEKSDWD